MFTEVGAILSQIWQLKWYEVLMVAIADDVIVFLKLWPLWIGLIVLSIIFVIVSNKVVKK